MVLPPRFHRALGCSRRGLPDRAKAWLRWYEAKQQWLAKDLAIAQEHSELLRKEKLSAQDGLRRMEEMARSAKREKQSLLHRSEMRNTDKSLEQLMWTQAQSVKEDRRSRLVPWQVLLLGNLTQRASSVRGVVVSAGFTQLLRMPSGCIVSEGLGRNFRLRFVFPAFSGWRALCSIGGEIVSSDIRRASTATGRCGGGRHREDQQLMQRKLPEVQAQLEAEKASAEQTRHKLEDTRRALEQEQAAERSAKRARGRGLWGEGGPSSKRKRVGSELAAVGCIAPLPESGGCAPGALRRGSPPVEETSGGGPLQSSWMVCTQAACVDWSTRVATIARRRPHVPPATAIAPTGRRYRRRRRTHAAC